MIEKTHAEKLTSGALWYANKGWKLLPCYGINSGGRCTCGGSHPEPKDAGKHPAIGEWNARATDDVATVSKWWSGGSENNIGVFCQASGFIVIDIDPRSGGVASFEKLIEMLGEDLPETVEAVTGVYTYNGVTARGRHLYFKVDEGEQFQGNLNAAGLNGIDIKHKGYVMLAPSRHASGVEYEWKDDCAPWQMNIAQAPESLLQVIRKRARRSGTSLGEGDWDWMDGLEYNGERVDIEKIVSEGIDEGSRAVDIYKLACALANKFGTSTDARMAVETMMIRFNHDKVRPPLELEGPGGLLMHVRRAIDFVAENPVTEKMWPGITDWVKKPVDGSAGFTPPAVPTSGDAVVPGSTMLNPIGEAISVAASSGISVSGAFSGNNVDVPKNPDALSEAEGGDAERRSLSDIGNGRRIVDSFGNVMRYTPGLGWFIWNGQYWKPDAEDLETQEIAKHLATIIASETATHGDDDDKKREVVKWAYQARGNARMRSAIDSARSDPRIINAVSDWDNDVHMLGVANGVIDLRTGELLKGRPDLHITKRAPVAYVPGMRNVRWEQFVDFATDGDKEFQDWLQRAVGYSLTGLNNQDLMFLVYGPGGSGKNTFVETIVEALGTDEYASKLSSEILASGDGASRSSDQYYMAELRGKRMIWVDELPESERMKENQVKSLTGSGTIQARSPGEKPFTFRAQGKLWITTNHRPIITDDAMWRRIRPIPWNKIPQNPDPDLKAYLADPEGGLPAVLAWAVEGAIKYLGSSARDPLGWCAVVQEAAEIYRKNEDRIGMFLDEETVTDEAASVTVKAVYQVYRMWSEERGEKPLTTIAFTRKLTDRGLEIVGQGSKAVIHGRNIPPRAVPSAEIQWASNTSGPRLSSTF